VPTSFQVRGVAGVWSLHDKLQQITFGEVYSVAFTGLLAFASDSILSFSPSSKHPSQTCFYSLIPVIPEYGQVYIFPH